VVPEEEGSHLEAVPEEEGSHQEELKDSDTP
jgi:hypothetical protein